MPEKTLDDSKLHSAADKIYMMMLQQNARQK